MVFQDFICMYYFVLYKTIIRDRYVTWILCVTVYDLSVSIIHSSVHGDIFYDQKICHIHYMWMAFLQYVYSGERKDHFLSELFIILATLEWLIVCMKYVLWGNKLTNFLDWNICYIDYIWMAFHQYVFFHDVCNYLRLKISSHSKCSRMISHQYEFVYGQ